jgi:hypothetical protein
LLTFVVRSLPRQECFGLAADIDEIAIVSHADNRAALVGPPLGFVSPACAILFQRSGEMVVVQGRDFLVVFLVERGRVGLARNIGTHAVLPAGKVPQCRPSF